jgi:hypothetical protein
MQVLDHERLDVYHLALDFLVFVSTGREGIRFCRNHRAPVHFVEKRRSPPISGNDRVSA